MWVDDGGPFSPHGASCLYALTGREYRPALDQHAQFGTQVLAVFGGDLTGRNQTCEQVYDRLPGLVADLAARKQKLALTLVTDSGAAGRNKAFIRDHCRRLGGLLADPAIRPHVAMVVDENEDGHPTQLTFTMNELQELFDIVRTAGYDGPMTTAALLSLDEYSFPGSGWEPNIYPPVEVLKGRDQVFASFHYNRGKKPSYREALRAYEGWKVGKGYNVAMSNHEPGRWDHEELRVKDEYANMFDSPQVFAFITGALGVGMGSATVAHSSALRDCAVLDGLELSCMQAYLAGRGALPRGSYRLENTNNTGGHHNSPLENAAFVDPPASSTRKSVWRIYAVQHQESGQWFAILGGPDVVNHDLKFQNGFTRLGDRIAGVDSRAAVYPIF